MMISQKMADAINEQIKNEFFSYWLYLQMSFALEGMDLKVFAQWFNLQAEEEKVHAMKMAKYVLDQGGEVQLHALDQPKSDFKSVQEVVEAGLAHEKQVTAWINELMDLAIEEKDHASRSFFQWFVDEQVEEVATANELLSLVKMASSPDQLLLLENRIMSLRGSDAE